MLRGRLVLSPFEKEISAHEKIYSSEISKALNKALSANSVVHQVKSLGAKNVKPVPKSVVQLYEKTLSKALKSLPSKYKGLAITTDLKAKWEKGGWTGSVNATARFQFESRGGAKYTVVSGDTLWAIAKKTYGDGLYWPAIAAANENQVKSKGNFILAGARLTLPKVSIPKPAGVPAVTPSTKMPAEARKPAVEVLYPTYEFDLGKQSKPIVRTVKADRMTLVISTRLNGKVLAQKKGTLSGVTVNLRKMEMELKNGLMPFETSIKVQSLSVDAVVVSSNVSGNVWKSSLSFSQTAAIKVTVAPQPVTFQVKDVIYSGHVGFEIEIQPIPDEPSAPNDPPFSAQLGYWLIRNRNKIVGVGLCGGGLALATFAVANNVTIVGVADDAIAFYAAKKMCSRGLKLMAK